MIIIGIDPGESGAVASNLNGRLDYVHKFAGLTEREVAAVLLAAAGRIIDGEVGDVRGREVIAYLEQVHSMPKQGVSSTFKFGRHYGMLRGLLIGLEIPFEDVTPQAWQTALGCRSKGDKRVTRAKAQQLFPALGTITHATADAVLISEYGRRVRAGELAGKQRRTRR